MKVRVLVVVATLVASGGCRTAPIANVMSAPLPQAPGRGATMEAVSRAIWAAGKKLGWTIQETRPGEATGTLSLGKHVAVVTITYDTSRFSIKYKDSQNLLHQGQKIHRKYNLWVQKLSRGIQTEMAGAGTPPQPGI